jgi:D-beta-D-heptose 7-phosphate kinase/D-beta-D-heptose 1-phosphate adenosyltransferase
LYLYFWNFFITEEHYNVYSKQNSLLCFSPAHERVALKVTRSFINMNKKVILDFIKKDMQYGISINVIGDSILDEYYDVAVSRISPEFPIPVYSSFSNDPTSGVVPGGAANVAYQFKNFNVNVQLVSLVTSFAKVIFESKNIGTEYSKVVENMMMPIKRRIYSEGFPLVRWDIERERYGLDDVKKHLFELEIPDSNFNIFSDYNKGLFCVPWFRKYFNNAPSLVDPKNINIDFWEDCTVFKPNSKEAKYLSDKTKWQDQIDFFVKSLKCKSVLITRAANGFVGIDSDYFEYSPENKIEKPESVIGAGDCFAAFLTMALCRGFKLEEASQIAFAAGSCYVMNKNNHPVTKIDLLKYCGMKVIDCPEIFNNIEDVVFTNGCFDMGLTSAHIDCLKFAKSQGKFLVVGLNSDKSISRIKGCGRPIMSFDERANVLGGLGCVDFIVKFEEDTPYEIIKKIKPELIVKGGDYKKEEVVGNDIANVKIFNYVNCLSTTEKIKKMNNIL